ncbi:MAG: hypothetical protein LBR80_02390 [Deltaproteobacteria bacterium]|jgi:hypothetical protein|nr:hypothetical protein [Deltaproteobacteria bacterium]
MSAAPKMTETCPDRLFRERTMYAYGESGRSSRSAHRDPLQDPRGPPPEQGKQAPVGNTGLRKARGADAGPDGELGALRRLQATPWIPGTTSARSA